MKQSKYIVHLTAEERVTLEAILSKGKHSVYQINRAKILLALDAMSCYQNGPKRKYMPTHGSIAAQCGVRESTVDKVAKQYVTEGFKAATERKKREKPPITPIVTGEIEARIVALACSTPPEGYAKWTLRLLETKVVELGIMERVSDTTIYRV
jgi:hypothetical protein